MNRSKVKVRKKVDHDNINQKETRVAILISDKVDFRANSYQEHRETYSTARRHKNHKGVCIITHKIKVKYTGNK